jgi:hypothetical protein
MGWDAEFSEWMRGERKVETERNSAGYMYCVRLAGARLAGWRWIHLFLLVAGAGRLVFRACTDGAGTGKPSSFWGQARPGTAGSGETAMPLHSVAGAMMARRGTWAYMGIHGRGEW